MPTPATNNCSPFTTAVALCKKATRPNGCTPVVQPPPATTPAAVMYIYMITWREVVEAGVHRWHLRVPVGSWSIASCGGAAGSPSSGPAPPAPAASPESARGALHTCARATNGGARHGTCLAAGRAEQPFRNRARSRAEPRRCGAAAMCRTCRCCQCGRGESQGQGNGRVGCNSGDGTRGGSNGARPYLGRIALRPSHVHRLRPAIWPRLYFELDRLALAQAPEALCADVGLQSARKGGGVVQGDTTRRGRGAPAGRQGCTITSRARVPRAARQCCQRQRQRLAAPVARAWWCVERVGKKQLQQLCPCAAVRSSLPRAAHGCFQRWRCVRLLGQHLANAGPPTPASASSGQLAAKATPPLSLSLSWDWDWD